MQKDELCDAKKKAATLLQYVIEGSLSANQAREIWPEFKEDNNLEAGFHMLFHFEDDEDIRSKDERYAKWQIEELKVIIEKLNSDY